MGRGKKILYVNEQCWHKKRKSELVKTVFKERITGKFLSVREQRDREEM